MAAIGGWSSVEPPTMMPQNAGKRCRAVAYCRMLQIWEFSLVETGDHMAPTCCHAVFGSACPFPSDTNNLMKRGLVLESSPNMYALARLPPALGQFRVLTKMQHKV
jgi:hypothetical protein